MAPAPQLMRVDDYFKTRETLTPMELVFGAMRVSDAPTPRHQSAVLHLCLALDRHVRPRQLGRVWIAPLDVLLSERDALIVQPDLFFVSNEREWIVCDRVHGSAGSPIRRSRVLARASGRASADRGGLQRSVHRGAPPLS